MDPCTINNIAYIAALCLKCECSRIFAKGRFLIINNECSEKKYQIGIIIIITFIVTIIIIIIIKLLS